jgi:hypothetical protein
MSIPQPDERLEHLSVRPMATKGDSGTVLKDTLSESPEQPFPQLAPNLILALNTLFPERSYQPKDTLESVAFQGGQRSVIRWLIQEYDAQQKVQSCANPKPPK